jgi:hypothetical protein
MLPRLVPAQQPAWGKVTIGILAARGVTNPPRRLSRRWPGSAVNRGRTLTILFKPARKMSTIRATGAFGNRSQPLFFGRGTIFVFRG